MKTLHLPRPYTKHAAITPEQLAALNAHLGTCDTCGAQAVGSRREPISEGTEPATNDALGRKRVELSRPGKLVRFCAAHEPKKEQR